MKIRRNVVITAANLQHAVTLPALTRRVTLRSASGTSFRLSFTPGEVESYQGYSFSGKKLADTGWLHFSPTYLFLASQVPGNLIELEIITGPTTIVPDLPTETESL